MTRAGSLDDLAGAASRSDTSERSKVYALYQARLRAEEIDFVAREQYMTDLNKLVDASVAKLSSDYEFQRNETERKAKIEFSVRKNEARIRLLSSQQDILQRAMDEARAKLRTFRETPEYAECLARIIGQSLAVLNEAEAVVYVVPKDFELAENAIATSCPGRTGTARVDREAPLPERLIGGAIVSNVAATIRVDNSLEGRIMLAAEGALPQISSLLKAK
jgi:vacuolar-type H+-ATPase subunit E/Vma4